MFRAKEDVLWFKKGDVVEQIQDNWAIHFEEIKSEEPKKEEIKVEEVVKEQPKPKGKKK